MKLEVYDSDTKELVGKLDIEPSEIIALQQSRTSVDFNKAGIYKLSEFCRVQGGVVSSGYWRAWGSK